MISDQLSFIHIAKGFFDADDFSFIRSRRIGNGKIGGKAAGMLLAYKILQAASPELARRITLPDSYFIGADVFYDFISLNSLEYGQKYKSADQIRAEYPDIKAEYEKGRFPEEVADRLRVILERAGNTPLIVRSSSLLEDNFGTSFAGKYESYFCPNQDSPKENLRALTTAIRRIYASVYSPDALFYRTRMGLLDYDERMAILLQVVQGDHYKHYFFPALAGVALSRAPDRVESAPAPRGGLCAAGQRPGDAGGQSGGRRLSAPDHAEPSHPAARKLRPPPSSAIRSTPST